MSSGRKHYVYTKRDSVHRGHIVAVLESGSNGKSLMWCDSCAVDFYGSHRAVKPIEHAES